MQLTVQMNNGIPEISAESFQKNLTDKTNPNLIIVDVRRAEEFTGELGHIPGAKLVTLGPELVNFLEENEKTPDQQMVFVCRSGGRSAQATSLAIEFGFTNTANLSGGMLRWNELKFPVER